MKKIAFVISHVPDPRINKRIDVTKEISKTSLIYWNRQTVDIWEIKHNDIDNHEIRIKADYTNPLKRTFATLLFLMSAYKELKRINPNSIYTGNVDMLSVVYLYKILDNRQVKIIYEIADLHKLIIDKSKKPLFKILSFLIKRTEKVFCNKIDTLVVTSEKFYEAYYSKFVPKEKLLFLPNMPVLDVFNKYQKKRTTPFVVGFIGAVRYKEQMRMLINATINTNINVLFAGSGLDDDIEKESEGNPQIIYYGKYNYDSEISNLYSMVDCVFAVYDADQANVRIALPNKLYESIYCELPIVVSKNTYLAELVENFGVGVAVDHKNPNELIQVLNRLATDRQFYDLLVDNCRKQKESINSDVYNSFLKSRLIELQQI